jgi:hypothetical protein
MESERAHIGVCVRMWYASVICVQVMFTQQGVVPTELNTDDDDDGGVRSKR